MGGWVVGALPVSGCPQLIDHGAGEQVQDLVVIMSLREEALGRGPHLGRVVVVELVGHHLVHGQMQPRVDRPVWPLDVFAALRMRTLKLGMGGADQEGPVVGIGGVKSAEAIVAGGCWGNRAASPRVGIGVTDHQVASCHLL